MTVDIATLGLEIRSDGLVAAGNRLRKLSWQSGKTESKVKSNLQKMGAAAKQLQKNFFSLKNAMLSIGVGLIAKDIIEVGAKFEQTMIRVKAVSNATKKEFEELNAVARKMGETTEWSASQSADALQFLSMAGFTAKQSIGSLPGVLNLATAGSIDLGRAADISSNVLTAMRMEVSELSKVNDVFISTITTSNVNMENMAEAFKYAGSIGSAFGYTIDEISGYIGMLGNAGIQGSMAGTQLAMAMAQVDEAFKYYNKTGVDTSKYTNNLTGALKLLEDQGADAGNVLQIFGQRGGRGVAAMLGVGAEAVEKYIKTLEKEEGIAKRIADEFRNSTIGRWKEFKSVVESVKIDIFESQVGSLNDTIKEMSEYVRDNKDEIVDFVNSLVEAGKSLAPVVGVVGSFFSTAVKNWNLSLAFAELLKNAEKLEQLEQDQINKGSKRIIRSSLASDLKEISDNDFKEKQKNIQKNFNALVAAKKEEAKWHKEAEKELRAEAEEDSQISRFMQEGEDEIVKKKLQELHDKQLKLSNELYEKRKRQRHEDQKEVEQSIIDEYELSWEEAQKLQDKLKQDPIAFNFADDGLSGIANMMTGIDNLSGAWDKYAKKLEYIATLNADKYDTTKAQSDAEKTLIKSQLSGYSNLANAAGQYFEEGSSARKNLHNLEVTLGAIEMAMEAKKVAMSLAGIASVVAAKIGEASVLAAGAILGQGTGDPYTAFARMAAMAAMVGGVLASIGATAVAFGAGGGGGGGDKPQMAATSGTVLGSPTEGSESVSKSFEMLEGFNELQYGELQKIYEEVKNLNVSLTGISNSILRSVGVFNESGFAGTDFSTQKAGDDFYDSFIGQEISKSLNPDQWIAQGMEELFGDSSWSKYFSEAFAAGGKVVDELFGEILNGIFGETSVDLVQAGVEIAEISFKEISDGIQAQIRKFGVIETTVDKLVGSDDVTFETKYADASSDIERMMNTLLSNTVTSMEIYANALGLPIEKVHEYVAGVQKIDFKGLDAEETKQRLSEWYSTMFDTAMEFSFGDAIGKYQEASEGLAQTATRLIIGMQLVDNAMQYTGASFSATGEKALAANDALIKSSGGVEAFNDLINQFYDRFSTAGEKLKNTQNQLTETFDELGLVLPETKEGFKDLLASFDLADPASHKLYLKLLNLSDSFADVTEAAEDYKIVMEDVGDWFSSFGPDVSTVSESFKKIEDDLKDFREELEKTGQAIPHGMQEGGIMETSAKQWVAAIEKHSIASAIGASMFDAIADEQTKIDYEHWQRLQQINTLAEDTGNQYPELIESANVLYDLRSRQLDEEINTVHELKTFYEDLSQRLGSLKGSIVAQSASFQTRDQASGSYGQITQEYADLDPTSEDYFERSTELLESIWKTGNELFKLEDKAMQDLLEVQKEQLKAQLDTLNTQKDALEKQIGTLQQIETFLFDLTGGALAPVQSEEGMMKQYEKLLSKAQETGDISELESFIKGGFYEFFKSYGNYKDVNAMVVGDIMSLGDDISGGATLDDLETQLETLNSTIENINNEISNLSVAESTVGGMNLESWTESLLPLVGGVQGQLDTAIEGLDSEIASLNAHTLALIQSIDAWDESISAEGIAFDGNAFIASQSELQSSIEQLNGTVSFAFMDQLPVEQIVNTAYQNMFGRTPNDTGLDFWTEQLKSGTIAMSNFKDALASAAGVNDSAKLSQGDINVNVKIGEKPVKDMMVDITRKDNGYQKEIKRAVKVA